MVEMALKEDYLTSASDDNEAAMRSIFLNILELKDLDIRDKKSAIVDFIAAGIETVGTRQQKAEKIFEIYLLCIHSSPTLCSLCLAQ